MVKKLLFVVENMAKKFLYYKNKKALSVIVTTFLLIVISLVAVGLLGVFVNNLVKNQIGNNEACYGNYNKVEINYKYTCYEYVSSSNYNIRFSLSIGDIDVDKVLVGVSSASTSKSYEITKVAQLISGLTPYPSGTSVVLPNRDSGSSYLGTGFADPIEEIRIIPVIDGTQCEISDTLTQIENCLSLT